MPTLVERREQFKKLRTQYSLTQRQVSIDLGITEPHFRNLESGRGNPDAKLLFKMANYFGVSAETLFPDLAALRVPASASTSTS